MYLAVNKFLLSQQRLDFRRLPDFFRLFYGFDLEVKHDANGCFCFLVLQVINP